MHEMVLIESYPYCIFYHSPHWLVHMWYYICVCPTIDYVCLRIKVHMFVAAEVHLNLVERRNDHRYVGICIQEWDQHRRIERDCPTPSIGHHHWWVWFRHANKSKQLKDHLYQTTRILKWQKNGWSNVILSEILWDKWIITGYSCDWETEGMSWLK